MSKIKIRLRDKDPIKLKLKNAVQKIYPSLEDLYVVPSGQEQNFKSENYYGYDNVKVNAINLQDKTITPTKEEQVVKADKEFSGLNEVTITKPTLQNKIVNPTKEKQTIKADSEYVGLDNVTIEAVTSSIDENILPENIKKDIEVLGVRGVFLGEKYKPRAISFYRSTVSDLDYELENLDTSLLTQFQYFLSYSAIEKIDFTKIDTSGATSFANVCDYCSKLKEINATNLVTSKITDISLFTWSCNNLEKIIGLDTWDTSNITNLYGAFAYIHKINEFNLNSWNTSKVTNANQVFYGNRAESIYIGNWDFSKVTSIVYFANDCPNLVNLEFPKNLGKSYYSNSSNNYSYTVSFQLSKQLSHDSLMSIINNLYDLNLSYNVSNGGILKTQKLELGETNIAKLSAEEIAIATNKGWTVL